MNKLEEMKRKFKSGDYICVSFYGHDGWRIATAPKWVGNRRYRTIHKKHKDILDAVLEDINTKVYVISEPFLGAIDGNIFIKEYKEENQYSLTTFELNDVSDIKFLKPDWWNREVIIELYFVDRLGCLHGKDVGSNECIRWTDKGLCTTHTSEYNLIPYVENKKWYEDKKNFPALCVTTCGIQTYHRVTNKIDNELYTDDTFRFKLDQLRLITQEEKDSLFCQGDQEC